MPLRIPLEVRRAPAFDAQVAEWAAAAATGRGQEARWAQQRLREVARLESLLPKRPFLGRNVPKPLIPQRFHGMGVRNLFRNDLPGGWRLLHTVVEVDENQAIIELLALSHPDYDDLFGYRSR